MKKIFIIILILIFSVTNAYASSWYVRAGCSGATGNGTAVSCSDGGAGAWHAFSDIVWGGAGVVAGDTLYVIGTFTAADLWINAAGTAIGGDITIRGDNAAGAGQLGNAGTARQLCVNSYNTINGITVYGTIANCFDAYTTETVTCTASAHTVVAAGLVAAGYSTSHQFQLKGGANANRSFSIASITGGTPNDTIVVDTVGAAWTLVDGTSTDLYRMKKVSNVTITNSKIVTIADTWLAMADVSSVSNLAITNTEFDGGNYAGKGAYYIDGFLSWNRPSTQLLSGNYIHDVGSLTTTTDDAHCIGVQAVSGLTITNNHLKNCAAGIVIYPGTSSVQAILGLTISKNLIEGMNYTKYPGQWGGDGIVFTGGDSCPLCDAAQVYYNIITAPVNCPASNEFNCLGIVSKWSVQNKFYNNLVNAHDISFYFGVRDGDGLNIKNDLRNNISYNPTTYHMDLYPTLGTWTEDYNFYYPNTGTKFKIGGNTYNFANYQAAHPDTATRSVTHLYVTDPAVQADYKILTGSPAKDAGTVVGLNRDYFGNIVYQGSAPDIGVFEFGSPAPSYPYRKLGSGAGMSIQ